ncbi:MAG: arginine repressor [Oscillospiraceae bacterium]|jgi:transcriptional regulator of arginine metabolism
MKRDRLKAIRQIISEQPVGRQEDLMKLLNEQGYNVTQATVSRDIRELGLGKITDDNGNYRYVVAGTMNDSEKKKKFSNIFRDAVVSVTECGNLVVVKCHTGTGSAAAAFLDTENIDGVAGTVAGDDTIFIAVRDGYVKSAAETIRGLAGLE